MSDWRKSGSAVRRRAGAPSNHFDSVGSRNRVSLPTPEEALAGMARVGSPRVPMGTSMAHDFNNVSGTPVRGTLVPRGHDQGGEVYQDQTVPPASPGFRMGRPPVEQESLGASYRVTVGVPAPVMVEASATQANGRIVPASVYREDNFEDAMARSFRQ